MKRWTARMLFSVKKQYQSPGSLRSLRAHFETVLFFTSNKYSHFWSQRANFYPMHLCGQEGLGPQSRALYKGHHCNLG